jgi:glutamate racemase
LSIGVFDSGVGGLTVLAALRAALPEADLLYLGDTARVPYGARSAATVATYSQDCARWLIDQGCEQLVIACNTASAYGVQGVRQLAQDRQVHEVIGAGVQAAADLGTSRGVAVLATRGTVGSKAYLKALQDRMPGVPLRQVACPLLVPMVEEGWYDHEATKSAIRTYLAELQGFEFDRMILGCTHYPLIRDHLQDAVGAQVRLIDSSAAIAAALTRKGLPKGRGQTRLAFSDDPELSAHVVARIFPHAVHGVERIDWG